MKEKIEPDPPLHPERPLRPVLYDCHGNIYVYYEDRGRYAKFKQTKLEVKI